MKNEDVVGWYGQSPIRGRPEVSGRTYLVTGSASGIGAATTMLLREAGHRVVGLDLHDAEIEIDLSRAETRATVPGLVAELVGDRLDGVITCAGLVAAVPQTVSVNFFGTVEIVVGLRDLLAASPAPRVAVVSSLASALPHDPAIVDACLALQEAQACEAVASSQPDHTGRARVYSSSKTAISRWVRQTAPTPAWGGAGILLNAIAPGTVRTAMTAGSLATEDMETGWLAFLPNAQSRIGAPEEIGRALAWIASEANSMILGQTIFADLGTEAVLRGDLAW